MTKEVKVKNTPMVQANQKNLTSVMTKTLLRDFLKNKLLFQGALKPNHEYPCLICTSPKYMIDHSNLQEIEASLL